MPRGGRRPGAGRPREEGAQRRVLQVRADESSMDRWRLAAEAEGRPLSEVVRELLDGWSGRVLR